VTASDSPLRGIRLVALDLDGTLLPSSKVLTGRAKSVVRDVRAAGIEVTLATGKGWNHTRRYAEELGIEVHVVALEGGYVSQAGPGPGVVLSRRTLTRETLRRAHDAVADLDVGYFYCHDRWRTRAHASLERWLPQLRIWDPHVDLVAGGPADEAQEHDAFGLHLIGLPGPARAARDRLVAADLPEVDVFHAEFWDGHDQVHVRPAGVAKHAALRLVLDHLGVHESELLAAGDWLNDIGMMRMAGVAIAPSNAIGPVRAEADHVLPHSCEEDAVAAFLESALSRL
jgi:hydroxymethylpyrimidine pyrophosphatase-like HAD family hydrolase